jgi:hypothetical protein
MRLSLEGRKAVATDGDAKVHFPKAGATGSYCKTTGLDRDDPYGLVPTEGWGDRSQNCLHDVRIVGNT